MNIYIYIYYLRTYVPVVNLAMAMLLFVIFNEFCMTSLPHSSSTDDTNPETETEEYVNAIREDVEWMGWTPHVITHSSDYFAELHNLAIRLIKKGLAYVCHQTKEEITACREAAKTRQSNPNAPGVLYRYENLAPPPQR